MNNDLKAMMARYERELMQLRQQEHRPTPPAQPPVPPSPPVPPPTDMPAASTVYIRVSDAATGAPLPNALVALDRRTGSGREPIFIRFTDDNGEIEPVTVAADQPNTVYDITAAAPGYFRQSDTGIVADGSPIRRDIRLAPLPEL